MNIRKIMDNSHLTVSHNEELFDIDEIAEFLLNREVYDQNGSEFEVLEINGNNVTIKQFSYDIKFIDSEYIKEHVMKITGHIDGEYFVPDLWEEI